MCGRKTLTKSKLDIIRDLSIDEWDNLFEYDPSYNIAPTQQHPVIINDNGKKNIKSMHWGLIPSWAKDTSFAAKMINARQETLAEKPSFKNLINTQRCLIPIDGYYEWKKIDNQKYPYYILDENHDLFCLAGIWTTWKNPKGDLIDSYSIITTNANTKLNHIHHRMPVIQNDEMNGWLDNSIKFNEIQFSNMDPRLEFYPISTLVNSVKNNSAECIIESDINTQGSLF